MQESDLHFGLPGIPGNKSGWHGVFVKSFIAELVNSMTGFSGSIDLRREKSCARLIILLLKNARADKSIAARKRR